MFCLANVLLRRSARDGSPQPRTTWQPTSRQHEVRLRGKMVRRLVGHERRTCRQKRPVRNARRPARVHEPARGSIRARIDVSHRQPTRRCRPRQPPPRASSLAPRTARPPAGSPLRRTAPPAIASRTKEITMTRARTRSWIPPQQADAAAAAAAAAAATVAAASVQR